MFASRYGKAFGVALAVAVVVEGQAGSAIGGSTGVLYEALGNNGIAAYNLADPTTPVATLNVPATNIVAYDNTVYFSNGGSIYSTGTDLQGASLFKSNGASVTAMAIDPSAGLLYEALSSGEIVALYLSDPSRAAGFLGQSATGLVEANNTVYFSQGNTVYSTSDNLSGLNVINTNSVPITGLAFSASVPEPSTIVLMLSGAVALAGRWLHRRRGKERGEQRKEDLR